MNMKKNSITSKLMSGAFALMTIMSMSSCSGLVDAVFGIEDNPSGGTTKPTTVPGIPSDASATANPTLPAEANTVIPNISYSVSSVSGATVVRFDMTGIQDPADPTKWVTLSGTGESDENIWVSIDGKAAPRPVKTGISDGVNIQILKGLSVGDSVVVSQETLGSTKEKSSVSSPFMPSPPGKKKK